MICHKSRMCGSASFLCAHSSREFSAVFANETSSGKFGIQIPIRILHVSWIDDVLMNFFQWTIYHNSRKWIFFPLWLFDVYADDSWSILELQIVYHTPDIYSFGRKVLMNMMNIFDLLCTYSNVSGFKCFLMCSRTSKGLFSFLLQHLRYPFSPLWHSW